MAEAITTVDTGVAPAAIDTALGTAVAEPKTAEVTPVEGAPKEEAPKEGEQPKEGEKKEETPEYKLELKLPEGQELTPESLASFTEIAKSLNLKPEDAQKLADLHFGNMKASADAFAKAQTDAWTAVQKQWSDELEADPVLGGDAKKEAMSLIGRALDEYGSKEARDAFNITGAGNNPAIVRFVHNMAKMLVEAGAAPVVGEPAGRGQKTAGQVLYGENKE